MKLEFSRRIFGKLSDFTKIGPVGAELFHTDGHDEANNRFSQFCERARKIVTILIIPVTDILISDIFVHAEVCEVATAVTCL